ncbi:MAG: hypothetical protein MJA31_02665, partial [Clostridia bacterium]|nr:hypothetical protein [Clostridia bacterium]
FVPDSFNQNPIDLISDNALDNERTEERQFRNGRRSASKSNANKKGEFFVDLAEHEVFGGDTLKRHVGKKEATLKAVVRAPRKFWGPMVSTERKQHGSFKSLSSAQKLVNSTITQNQDQVKLVASGKRRRVYIKKTFNSKTGIEARKMGPNGKIVIRNTYEVAVVLIHTPDMPGGFIVLTAYPLNSN